MHLSQYFLVSKKNYPRTSIYQYIVPMTKELQNFIQKEKLFQSHEKVLIAVSGGIDSVVLCHLMHQAGCHFGIAHCNFQLRGTDSDLDAVFVKKLATTLQVPFFETSFKTDDFAKEKKLSIQVAARELRYEWLEKIRIKNDFQYIATAHHLDDSLETVLYNFTKGCGIRGLHGILPKNQYIIRPLLFTHKKEILAFAKNQAIDFREDISNATDKYARNSIRHHVVPILEKINPALPKTTAENITRLRETEQLFNYAIESLKKEICKQQKDQLFIHLEKLKNAPAPKTLLFEWLSPFGFNNSQTGQMFDSIGHQAGAIFNSPTHQLLLDREFFILEKNNTNTEGIFLIHKSDSEISFFDYQLIFKTKAEIPQAFPKEKNIAFFDLEKIVFPLILRKWKAGDYFYPIGMNGQKKKVKALLTDLKLNRFEKENIWVLESEDNICWVLGIRMDEHFKLDKESKNCLEVHFI